MKAADQIKASQGEACQDIVSVFSSLNVTYQERSSRDVGFCRVGSHLIFGKLYPPSAFSRLQSWSLRAERHLPQGSWFVPNHPAHHNLLDVQGFFSLFRDDEEGKKEWKGRDHDTKVER